MDPLRILMVSAEFGLLARAGCLADQVEGLALALAARGHEVRVAVPRYYFVPRDKLGAALTVRLPWEGGETSFDLHTQRLAAGAECWFVDREELYGRDGVYGLEPGSDFSDNARRFAFLGHAALASCQALGWHPDIVHGHDWPAAAALALADAAPGGSPFEGCATVLTIHDIAYQGLFPGTDFRTLGLPASEFRPGSFEFFGRLNCLQGAIRHARAVTTVSPGYARDILSPRFGFGLEGILHERRSVITGIIDGLDYAAHPDAASRPEARRNLARRLGWDEGRPEPIVALPLPADPQRLHPGLLAETCLPALLAEGGIRIAAWGNLNSHFAQGLARLAAGAESLKLHAVSGGDPFSPEGADFLSGADFLLVASPYEPGVEALLRAMAAGTVPIVPAVGAPGDIVRDPPGHADLATGIHIATPLEPASVAEALRRARAAYANRQAFASLSARAAALRLTWDDCASAHEVVYRNARSASG